MKTALRIAGKEINGFRNSAEAYLFLILFVVTLSGSYFVWGFFGHTFFQEATTEMDVFFYLLPWAFILLIPALSMKLWPDELKRGTIEVLLSYPVKSWQVVLGKFLGGLAVIVLALLCTVGAPIIVSGYGSIDWGPVVGAYLGGLLLGAAFLSVGLFMGALCKEQVSAFILTAFVCLLFVAIGASFIVQTVPEKILGIPFREIGETLSFYSRFEHLGRGIVDLENVIYFLAVTTLFLVLNITVIECRKGK